MLLLSWTFWYFFWDFFCGINTTWLGPKALLPLHRSTKKPTISALCTLVFPKPASPPPFQWEVEMSSLAQLLAVLPSPCTLHFSLLPTACTIPTPAPSFMDPPATCFSFSLNCFNQLWTRFANRWIFFKQMLHVATLRKALWCTLYNYC